MANAKSNIELFKKAVKKCILLSAEDANFWLNEADSLPEIVIVKLLPKLTAANTRMDEYIDKALLADTEKVYLRNIKSIVQKAKKNIAGAGENEEKASAEEDLLKSLENIDN